MYDAYIITVVFTLAFIFYSTIVYCIGYWNGSTKKYNDFVYEIELGYVTYDGKFYKLVEGIK